MDSDIVVITDSGIYKSRYYDRFHLEYAHYLEGAVSPWRVRYGQDGTDTIIEHVRTLMINGEVVYDV